MTELPLALVVEDDAQMRDIITFALETQQLRAITAGTVADAWALLREHDVDLVVLDVMLPDGSGVDLCRRITALTSAPVILLTALGETSHRIAGLEAGAADYVPKPFHPRELALRAAGLVRRTRGQDDVLDAAGLRVDVRRMTATAGGTRVELTPHELRLLALFLEHPGEVLPFRTLLLAGWGDPNLIGGRELLKTTLYRVRSKLDAADPGSAARLQSVRGVGYVLDVG